jgi:L-lactate dehydrogenase complex protein LldE
VRDVALMVTCLADVLRPEAALATVRVLRRLGYRVSFPRGQTCCGQPFYNSGFHGHAADLAKHTIRQFEGTSWVVTPSASCAAMVRREYPELLASEPDWHQRAQGLAARIFELSEFLVRIAGTEDVGASFCGRVTFHYACHLRALGVTDEPVRLLKNVRGLELVTLPAADECCGFGGSFSVRFPEISVAMVDTKVRHILETNAQVVTSTDTGCLLNIAGRLRRIAPDIQVLHLAEILASS